MKKATIAFVFAALSVGTMGCKQVQGRHLSPGRGHQDRDPPADRHAAR
jgi:hypothetical protein